jgi:hypothetical protein
MAGSTKNAALTKMPCDKFCNILNFFQECNSGLADFHDISGLAIGGLQTLKISGLAFCGFKKKISGLAISGPNKKLPMPTSAQCNMTLQYLCKPSLLMQK